MGLIPAWGTKIPHAVGQLSLCTTTREDSGQPKQKNQGVRTTLFLGVSGDNPHSLPQVVAGILWFVVTALRSTPNDHIAFLFSVCINPSSASLL